MARRLGQSESTLELRGRIAGLAESGLSFSEISRRVGLSVSKSSAVFYFFL